ncbi:MAG: hemerythrin domain-containing protein [Kiloniellaceae bacterium]
MSDLVRRLRKEHTDMAVLLDMMDRQIARFDRGEAPDYDVVRGILDYFLTYPDLYHHPKEDMVLRTLQARNPDKAAELNMLLTAHHDLALLTRRFATATIDQMINPQESARTWFGSLARAFVDANRRHMAIEEERFFPTVLRALTEADWEAINEHVVAGGDPLFDGRVEERFQALRDAIHDAEQSKSNGRRKAE